MTDLKNTDLSLAAVHAALSARTAELAARTPRQIALDKEIDKLEMVHALAWRGHEGECIMQRLLFLIRERYRGAA